MLTENTPYDDAFKTVIHDCKSLLIPFVNEVFQEHFTDNASVSFSSNEHYLSKKNGFQEKRISDAIFTITEQSSKKYHCECQSDTDTSIMVRLFEYHSQAALDDVELHNGELTVSFPHSAILYLRYPRNTPDTLKIHIQTPGGTVSYDVMVIKLRNYSLDDIFEKRLFLLLPFYIFHYDHMLENINASPEKTRELKNRFIEIRDRLERMKQKGILTEFIKVTLMDMSQKVARNFAKNYDNVKEGVNDVMGGKILETEAKKLLIQGRVLEYIDIQRENGYTDDEIIQGIQNRFHLSIDAAKAYVLAPATVSYS